MRMSGLIAFRGTKVFFTNGMNGGFKFMNGIKKAALRPLFLIRYRFDGRSTLLF
jgi:hypothetical protein